MRITAALQICLFLVLSLTCRPARGQDGPLTKLADNVYVMVVSPDGSAVANAGVVVLESSVLVFDTHFTPEAGQALLAAIRTVTPKPVRYLVNSHGHPDHTHGNQVFGEAQIIGSRAARRHVLEVDLPSLNRTMSVTKAQLAELQQQVRNERDPDVLQRLRAQIQPRRDYIDTMTRLQITAPVLTFENSLTIREGKDEVRLLYLGRGHTDGDIVLLLPAQKIAFVGDLFFNTALPNTQDAFLLDWRKTVREVLMLPADRFVPGHGAVGGRKEVEAFASYLDELHSLVKESVDRGDTAEQAQAIALPAKYSSYGFQNFFPANVQKMYAELKALQPPRTAE